MLGLADRSRLYHGICVPSLYISLSDAARSCARLSSPMWLHQSYHERHSAYYFICKPDVVCRVASSITFTHPAASSASPHPKDTRSKKRSMRTDGPAYVQILSATVRTTRSGLSMYAPALCPISLTISTTRSPTHSNWSGYYAEMNNPRLDTTRVQGKDDEVWILVMSFPC